MRSFQNRLRFGIIVGASLLLVATDLFLSAADKPRSSPPGFQVDPALPAGEVDRVLPREPANKPEEEEEQEGEPAAAPDEKPRVHSQKDAMKPDSERPDLQYAKPSKGVGKYSTNVALDKAFALAQAIQEKHSAKLMTQKGIVGTGLGLGRNGQPVIHVYLTGADSPVIPTKLEGVPVETVKTGPIFFQANPKSRFKRPVPIGVSSGPSDGPTSPICHTGTLGCRVIRRSDRKNVYGLSNNHVFALQNVGPIGAPIFQPGPADNNCGAPDSNRIGVLAAFVPKYLDGVTPNYVDCAIAKMDKDALASATPKDGYGNPQNKIANAFLGQKVMKYGRTSGFTPHFPDDFPHFGM